MISDKEEQTDRAKKIEDFKIWTRTHFTDGNRRPLSRAVKHINIWTRTHFTDDNRRPLRKAASQIKHLHKTLYKYIGKSAWGK